MLGIVEYNDVIEIFHLLKVRWDVDYYGLYSDSANELQEPNSGDGRIGGT